jgi:hypothetical protein
MYGPLPALTGLSGLSGMTPSPPPQGATHFGFTTPGQVVTEVEFSFDVFALTAGETIDTAYSGTVTFASSDPDPVLPADTTLTAGQGTLNATLKTIGLRSLTATDVATASITGTSAGIDVIPPP